MDAPDPFAYPHPARRAAGRAYRNVAMPRSMSARMERRYPIPRLAASIRASRRSGIRMSARANRCVTGSAKPRSHSPRSARSTNASAASSVGRDGQGPSSSSIKSLHLLFVAWVGRRMNTPSSYGAACMDNGHMTFRRGLASSAEAFFYSDFRSGKRDTSRAPDMIHLALTCTVLPALRPIAAVPPDASKSSCANFMAVVLNICAYTVEAGPLARFLANVGGYRKAGAV